jgi:hypothetical protein
MLRGVPCQRCALKQQTVLQTSEGIPWDALRIMWGYDETASPSHRRSAAEQLSREYPDLVHFLSRLPPPPCSSCWADGSWEDGLSRTQEHEPDRVNKLKALGNSIVPQVAYAILSAWNEAAA